MTHYARKLAILALLSVFLALPVAGAAFADDGGTAIGAVDAGAGAASAPTGIATSPHESVPSIDDPGAVIQALKDAKGHAGLIAVIALAVFLLAGAAIKASGHVGWLATGRRLAAITAVSGFAAAVFDQGMTGASWSTLAGPLVAAVALVLHPVAASA
jgi:hypothetical protein